MVRLVMFLIGVAALAVGLSWLADRPGSLVVTWQGYQTETSVFRAIVLLTILIGLAVLAWILLRQLWQAPSAIAALIDRRRRQRGLEALSGGMIAVGAGDRGLAMRYALQARKALPNEPLTHLLRAQAAQLGDDRVTARRIFEAMLGSPDTELLGLRGLFLEAEREAAVDAARQFAERAVALNPKLAWPLDALFDIQCRQSDWAGALTTTDIAKRHHHIDKAAADRRRAVLLTAQAQALEDSDSQRALGLARAAHESAPDLVPAAAIAGRLLASRGNTRRAMQVLQRTWKKEPHPDLATAAAYARLGDSPRDRLDRVQQLAALRPYSIESQIAVAAAAVEAHAWDVAREALAPLLDDRATQRVCTLMARIEGLQHRDAGRVRAWLARAVSAPADPAWTADGVVSDHWMAVSPVTGALDAFVWRVPVEAMDNIKSSALAAELEEIARLVAPQVGETVAPREDQAWPQQLPAVQSAAPTVASAAHDAVPVEPATLPPDHTGRLAAAVPPVAARAAGAEAQARPAQPDAAEQSVPATIPAERTMVGSPAATAPAADPAASPTPSSAPSDRGEDKHAPEPRIFVPPRAPDDPGTEPEEERRSALMTFRIAMKGQT